MRQLRAPVLEHTHQGAARQVLRDQALEHMRKPHPVESGRHHQAAVVDDERPGDVDLQRLLVPPELPCVMRTAREAPPDAPMKVQVLRRHGPVVIREIGG